MLMKYMWRIKTFKNKNKFHQHFPDCELDRLDHIFHISNESFEEELLERYNINEIWAQPIKDWHHIQYKSLRQCVSKSSSLHNIQLFYFYLMGDLDSP